MSWEPTDEEVRAFCARTEHHISTDDEVVREHLRAAWAVSPGPRRTDALDDLCWAAGELLALHGASGTRDHPIVVALEAARDRAVAALSPTKEESDD